MEIGSKANTMVSAPSPGLMAVSTEVSGADARRTARANSLGSTGRCTKETGRMASIMDEESCAHPMASSIRGCSRMGR